MKHLKSINEAEESEKVRVRVKDLIEYLSKLDPEMEVGLDKDGWEYYETGLETVENSYLFHVWPTPGSGYDYPPRLTINN